MTDVNTVAAVGVLALASMGVVAIHKGINGKLFTAIVGAITFVVGYCFPIR